MPQKRAAQSVDAVSNTTKQPAKKQSTASARDGVAQEVRPAAGRDDPTVSSAMLKPNTSKHESIPKQPQTSDEDITTVNRHSKPSFVLPASLSSHSLHDRLRSFLPELAQSNEKLAHETNKSLEDVGDEEEHISMELGLGVLEQQPDESDKDETDSGSDSSKDSKDHATPVLSKADDDHMRKLLGQSTSVEKANIEEVG
ncbi:hypothetical protein AMS68_000020 [Peltaster fructicola]|uniref:Uncharacterized protein n=1 Tax=Peltaster fructicola TaxID=286661 RepID=A0A6H0XIF3_9PEZI|nr:hypothetical protein AMS68_000020 [Peltaster fructicola]